MSNESKYWVTSVDGTSVALRDQYTVNDLDNLVEELGLEALQELEVIINGLVEAKLGEGLELLYVVIKVINEDINTEFKNIVFELSFTDLSDSPDKVLFTSGKSSALKLEVFSHRYALSLRTRLMFCEDTRRATHKVSLQVNGEVVWDKLSLDLFYLRDEIVYLANYLSYTEITDADREACNISAKEAMEVTRDGNLDKLKTHLDAHQISTRDCVFPYEDQKRFWILPCVDKKFCRVLTKHSSVILPSEEAESFLKDIRLFVESLPLYSLSKEILSGRSRFLQY